jgi:hypothetical protein
MSDKIDRSIGGLKYSPNTFRVSLADDATRGRRHEDGMMDIGGLRATE